MPTRFGLLCWSAVLVALCPMLVRAGPPTDLYGDPLPQGALARLGTLRWRHHQPVFFVRHLADGKHVVTATANAHPITSTRNVHFQVWDTAGRLQREFGQQREVGWIPPSVNGFLLSADGRILVEGDSYACVRVWDVTTGKYLRQIQIEPPIFAGPTGRENPLIAAALGFVLAPDGNTLILKGWDRKVKHVRLSDGATLRTWQAPAFHPGQPTDPNKLPEFNGEPVSANWLAFLEDGKVLVSVDAEIGPGQPRKEDPHANVVGVVTFWDMKTGKVLRQFPLARAYTQVMAFSPDGKRLAVARNDRSGGQTFIDLYDARTGKKARGLAELTENSRITHLTFSPNGSQLATQNLNRVVRLWEVATGKEKLLLGRQQWVRLQLLVNCFDGFNDKRLSFSTDGKVLLSATDAPKLRCWDTVTGKEIAGDGHYDWVTGLAAGLEGGVTTLGLDQEACRWHADGKLLQRFRLPHSRELDLAPDGSSVACLAALDWGELSKMSALCNAWLGYTPAGTHSVHLWDARTGKQRWASRTLEEHSTLAYSFDSKTLLVRSWGAEQAISLRDVATGKETAFLGDWKKPLGGFGGDGCTQPLAALSPGGAWLAMTSVEAVGTSEKHPGGFVRLWDVGGRRQVFEFDTNNEGGFSAVHFSPDGRTLAAVNRPGGLTLWEIAAGKQRGEFLEKIRQPRFSPDGRLLAAAGLDGVVRVWDARAVRKLAGFRGHRGEARCVAFTPDGKRLLSGGSDGTVLVWDLTPLLTQLPASVELTAGQVEQLWADLGSDNAAKAYRAINALNLSPAQVLPWLDKHLQPAPVVTAAQVRQWLEDLDAKKFTLRQQAAEALAQQGMAVEPALQKALAANPSLEMRRRLEALLAQASKRIPSGLEMRPLRAAEVLERIGTPAARALLQRLARGGPTAPLTRDALAALSRLDGR